MFTDMKQVFDSSPSAVIDQKENNDGMPCYYFKGHLLQGNNDPAFGDLLFFAHYVAFWVLANGFCSMNNKRGKLKLSPFFYHDIWSLTV